jgi:hypothetical protein
MGINSTEVSYGFGQMGSLIVDTNTAATPPTGKVFVAIQFLTDTTFDASGGLVADNDTSNGLEYVGTEAAAHDAVLSPDLGESGTGGVQVDASNTFPQGMTIYGRWTGINLNSTGTVIAYIGD